MSGRLMATELETIARRRRNVLASKAEAARQFREELDGLARAESRVLANLDAARNPAPPLIAKMEAGEDLIECHSCGDAYTPAEWEAKGGKCPGCGR